MFDRLPTQSFEVLVPNPYFPEHPTTKTEQRVSFKPLFDAVYAEARADGSIWIPFEETSPKRKPDYADFAEAAESKQAAPVLEQSNTETTLRAQAHLVTTQIMNDSSIQ